MGPVLSLIRIYMFSSTGSIHIHHDNHKITPELTGNQKLLQSFYKELCVYIRQNEKRSVFRVTVLRARRN